MRSRTSVYVCLKQDINTILLEANFENYSEAQKTGPYTVIVTSGSASMEIVKDVGFCAFAACAGPMELEVLTVTLNPDRPDHILGYYCEGLDGTLSGGIDVSGTGDCR